METCVPRFSEVLKLSIVSRPKLSEISFAFFPTSSQKQGAVGIIKYDFCRVPVNGF